MAATKLAKLKERIEYRFTLHWFEEPDSVAIRCRRFKWGMLVKMPNAPLRTNAATFGNDANVPELASIKVSHKNPRSLRLRLHEIATINQELNELCVRVDVVGTAISHSEVFGVSFNAESKHDTVVLPIVVWPRERLYGVRRNATRKLY